MTDRTIATIGPHPDPSCRGVWCVFIDDASGEDHYRILSTHSTRDGARVSANQINKAAFNEK
jgi:hypothetical protein